MCLFEVAMLICFGMSWPVSILKSIRTGMVIGKSPLFMTIVCFGYALWNRTQAAVLHGLGHSALLSQYGPCDYRSYSVF